MVMLYGYRFGPVAYSNYFIRLFHTLFFNCKYFGIDMVAGAIDFSGMYMHDERFSADFLCFYSRQVSHPVMGMNDIKGVLPRNFRPRVGIPLNFLHQIGAIGA
jgi:hypothetical protein